MRNNMTWYSRCKKCNRQIANFGSGRPRNNCGNHKKLKRIVKTLQQKKDRQISYIKKNTAQDHAVVRAEKLRVGRCALHPFMENGAEYLVTERNVVAFCWDHVDRQKKISSVSQMVGRNGPYNEQNLRDEMAKCILVCANCHQIKTYEENDYRQIDRVIDKTNQATLFDI